MRRSRAGAMRVLDGDAGERAGIRAGLEFAFEAFEVGAHFGGGLIAEVAVLVESLLKNGFKLFGNFGIQADWGNRRAVHDGLEDEAGGFAAEGKLAGAHLVKDYAERKKIRAGIEFLAANKLGRQIGDGAERRTGAGE